MSQFILSDKHISAILDAARPGDKMGQPISYFHPSHGGSLDEAGLMRAGQLMKEANWRSLTEVLGLETGPIPPFVMTPPAQPVSTVGALKLIQSFIYQSDEWSRWPGSEAEAIVKAIEFEVIRRMPGYDAEPWLLK